MVEAQPDLFTVAIVWRGDAQARRDAQPQTSSDSAVQVLPSLRASA